MPVGSFCICDGDYSLNFSEVYYYDIVPLKRYEMNIFDCLTVLILGITIGLGIAVKKLDDELRRRRIDKITREIRAGFESFVRDN